MITLAYLRIYRVVPHHQNQIHSQSQIQNDQAMKAAREKKSALNAFYVYIISLSCYLPSTFSVILLEVNRSQISVISTAYGAFFLVFLNSSLNPLVYCWRYREMRNIVKSTAKKMCRMKDHTVHHATNNNLFAASAYPNHYTGQITDTLRLTVLTIMQTTRVHQKDC